MTHLGNTMLVNRDRPEEMVTGETLNAESLKERFDTDNYLTPHSDIVALLVFEHQMRMMNLLTRMGWETRVAVARQSAGISIR
jgi:hypothetical protein